jgi:hypothetical protein
MLGPDPVADLKAFVVERAPYHQKMFRRSLVSTVPSQFISQLGR